MSDEIKHKCGIALVRLLKPLEYYQLKYGSWQYGLQKLYLLMEKQRNRGQDGAGVVSLKLDMPSGNKYFSRQRSMKASAISDIFEKIYKPFEKLEKRTPGLINDAQWAKLNLPFVAETYLGHLRYGTFGMNNIDALHPVMRENNWKTRNLVLAGNFNLTNVDELFKILVELGQSPKDYSDTVTILEKIGHFLDQENQELFRKYKNQGYSNTDISALIAKNIDLPKILNEAARRWDGGFVIAGMLGHGDSFVLRDPWGIRPAFYYHDEEVAVVASERPVIQTAFNLTYDKIKEVPPGYAVIIRKNGEINVEKVLEPQERKSCSFERIYFSRGSDIDIYKERKELGRLIVPAVIKAIDYDISNTVFSFIPNTSESAFYGMIKGVEDEMINMKKDIIRKCIKEMDEDKLLEIISERPRVEKVALKDIKLRTFISQDKGRNDLVGHVYDTTYGTIKRNQDKLVVIDDSIVRGTTLKESILKILDRLGPTKIVVVSSSPQIRYPDCYGIDMAKLGDFIAFKAAIQLLKDKGKESIINEVYLKCRRQIGLPKEEYVNYVKEIYQPFTPEEISAKIAQLLKGPDLRADLEIVYQSVENLHSAIPNDRGDWYFTGNYPTPGGNKVVSTSFVNYIEGIKGRAY
ncbi:MAG: amidophosphoribosyltransferase [Bacteroidales bacterium]|nr:amidophosphoribosyltransferase [Bacteroidales bacterium]MCF8391560.1 amidophosphoribosyltransferase [Bacteroidales bacterium]